MLTDDTLTTLLRDTFTDATAGLAPDHNLAAAVRRRHSADQRRRAAVRIGVPAVAAASIGAALSLPARHAAVHHPNAAASTHATSAPASTVSSSIATVSYRVAFPAKFGSVGCVQRPPVQSSSTWLLEAGSCGGSEVIAVINTDTTLPSDAKPFSIGSLTGLYQRIDGDSRTIWAPNGRGSYYSLDISAATPNSEVAAFFTPAN